MKRFEFSLETVLKLRKSEEQEWENRLASATGECIKIKKMIEHFESEKLRCAVDNRFTNISNLIAVANYQARMDSQRKAAQNELVLKEKERESVLLSFIEASKKRKILDKLKEHKLVEYHHLQKKDEERKNDDINNAKSARERSG
ncbi:MAG: flagellar export protein FliJ [bacterium]|nr:flagellar export protein FliJ [bacterium]